MSLVVLGMNHRTADLALLERVAVPPDEHHKALQSLLALDHVLEAVVLSTCNRVEVYAHVTRFHDGLHALGEWFAARAESDRTELIQDGVGGDGAADRDGLGPRQYGYHDEEAAAHLFAVACGADSLIVGERQIGLQVKHAAQVAAEEDASRRMLRRLFDHALFVTRRVRAETDLSAGAGSMVDVGLELVEQRLGGPLTGRTVLVVGAGKMGGLTGERLRAAGSSRILVRNRSEQRAARLAQRVDAEVVADGELPVALASADVVVCCAGTGDPVLDRPMVAAAVTERDAPLVLLDLGLPRNVDPACAELGGVELIDLDDVTEVARERPSAAALAAARAIIDAEARRFHAWLQAVGIDPTIRALRSRAESVRRAELERVESRLAGLDERQRRAVEALSEGIINTLLHEPSVRLKQLADRGGAEHYAHALRELFELDE